MIDGEEAAQEWVRRLPEYDQAAFDRLHELIVLLKAENTEQNLVSSASLGAVWRRHIADSAQLLAHVPRGTAPWLDLGSGAGFPGLVIAALRPELEITLVESRKRRVEWLERVSKRLGLNHVRVAGMRLESLGTAPFRVLSARAFAPLDRLIALAARFSTEDTTWVLPKGKSARAELDSVAGWNHTFHVKQSLTDPESGVVVGRLRA